MMDVIRGNPPEGRLDKAIAKVHERLSVYHTVAILSDSFSPDYLLNQYRKKYGDVPPRSLLCVNVASYTQEDMVEIVQQTGTKVVVLHLIDPVPPDLFGGIEYYEFPFKRG